MSLYFRTAILGVLISVAHVCIAQSDNLIEQSQTLRLGDVVEKVYQALPERLAEQQFVRQQSANDLLASAMFAQPSSVSLTHFNDAVGSSDGMQEWEGAVQMPLWLPGQKQSQQALSEKIMAQLPAYQQQLKLTAAGQVRTLLWQVINAQTKMQQSWQAWQTAQKLEQDVIAKVEAGELATTEKLLANSNAIDMQTRYLEAENSLQSAIKQYQFITGENTLPADIEEQLPADTSLNSQHPSLALLDQHIARLRSELGLAQYTNAVNPSLSVGVRRERGNDDESFNHSLSVGVNFAIDDGAYRQPAIAEASAALTDAEISRQQKQRALNTILIEKLQTLKSYQGQLGLFKQQHQATEQYFKLQKQAFELGEINLVSLLQSQTLLNQSVNRLQSLEVNITQAVAEVNQALGLLP